MSKRQQLTVRVFRQDAPSAESRWDVFRVDEETHMTVADVLHAINLDPRTVDGQPTTSIVWAAACTWPACGVCTMLINGQAAPACGTRVNELRSKRRTLTLAPMKGFPLRRDLWVDRTRMRTDVRRVEAFREDGEPPDEASSFAACTRCGACLDACPETHPSSGFVGPYALGAAHATRIGRDAVLPAAIFEPGGIADCGHVQNCVEVCPEAVPLDRAIRTLARVATRRWLDGLLRR